MGRHVRTTGRSGPDGITNFGNVPAGLCWLKLEEPVGMTYSTFIDWPGRESSR